MHEARKHWIIGRALYEAITRLTGLPDERRPESDIEDMYELLNELYPDVLGAMVARDDERLPPDPVVKLVPKATPPEDDTTA